jgi:hypothetical protein
MTIQSVWFIAGYLVFLTSAIHPKKEPAYDVVQYLGTIHHCVPELPGESSLTTADVNPIVSALIQLDTAAGATPCQLTGLSDQANVAKRASIADFAPPPSDIPFVAPMNTDKAAKQREKIANGVGNFFKGDMSGLGKFGSFLANLGFGIYDFGDEILGGTFDFVGDVGAAVLGPSVRGRRRTVVCCSLRRNPLYPCIPILV